MSEYYFSDWFKQDKEHQSSFLKRNIYSLLRPILSFYSRHYISNNMLDRLKPSMVLPGRGMPLETRRLWGAAPCNIKDSVLLVQGTGSGWDVISWARLKPRKIIATDLFEFSQSWDQISKYCKDYLCVDVDFFQAPLEDHSFLSNDSVDLCASDAVFEHCVNLELVLQESFRVLKARGTLYATYGPLYFCAGGDHFSGRGGLENAFNHILLNHQEYMKYFQEFLQKNEDFQSGGRYIELDLFSKLKTDEYLDLFKKCGFLIDKLIIEVSPTAIAFKKQFPQKWLDLKRSQNITEDDLLISANFIRLVKSSK